MWNSKEFSERHPYLSELTESMEEAHAKFIPLIPEYTSVILPFTGYVSEAIAGKYTPKEAMSKAEGEIYEVLKRAGYYK